MAKKIVTITKSFNRYELIGTVPRTGKPAQYNEVITSGVIMRSLLGAGVPVVGVLGVVAVEWGKLTIEHEDGLDGDEWRFTWTGEEVPRHWREKMSDQGYRNRLDKPLRKQIDDEL